MRSSIVSRIALLIAASLLISVCFAEIYHAAAFFVEQPWIAAALVNTVFAALVFWRLWRRVGLARQTQDLVLGRWTFPMWTAFLPAIVVFFGALALVSLSSMFGTPLHGEWSWVQLTWLLWIPLIEEIVFRVGVGNGLRRIGGILWGSYFSALVFSLVHLHPTVQRVAAGEIGVALGPFLLGLCCEGMWCRTRRLGPIIAFHAACNATALVFTLGDKRWMEWLRWLYL